MRLCPQCRQETAISSAGTCPHCDWRLNRSHDIPVLLSDEDQAAAIVQDYTENYEDLAVKNLEQSNIDRRFLLNQAKNVVRYLGEVRGQSVCDIGIGQGFLARELLAAGVNKVTAIDVSISYLRELKGIDRVEPLVANAENLPFREEFDLIVSTDVMEHVLNVGSFLYCVNEALRPGGKVCIRVPYREGLLGYSPHTGYQHRFGHLRSFNKDILRLYMREAGFGDLRFHLDGFSLGTPQPHLYDRPWKQNWYNRLARHLGARVDNAADVALWPSAFMRLIARPVEVAILARKIRSVCTP